MLETMRRASKTWVAALFIGVLVMSFALFGIGDVFTGSSERVVAVVGDTEISTQEFDRALREDLQRLRQQQGLEISVAQAHEVGYDRDVLERLMAQRALDIHAKDMGLRVGNDTLRRIITSLQGFQAIDGSFDINTFNQYLQRMNISQQEFENRFRLDVVRQQLVSAILAGTRAPSGYVLALRRHEDERRAVEFAVLTPEALAEAGDPDDAVLEAYLAENAGIFRTPEYRSFTMIAIGPDQLGEAIVVTDEEVAAAWEATRARFSRPEKRTLDQIVFPTREEAEAAAARMAAGESFDAIAAERGLTPEDLSLGEVPKGDPLVPAVAFEVAAGTTTPAAEAQFGWVILRVVSITPGEEKTLADMRDEIVAALRRRKAQEELDPIFEAIEDARGARTPFEEIAQRLNLKLLSVAAMDAAGNDPAGAVVTGIPGDPRFLQEVFALDAGQESETLLTQDSILYAVRLDGITPPATKPLSEIRQQVLEAWRVADTGKRLNDLAADLAARAASGEDMADMLRTYNVRLTTLADVSRTTATDDLPAGAVNLLFRAKPGQWITTPNARLAPEGSDEGPVPLMVVARATSVSFAAAPEGDTRLAELGGQTAQSLAGDLLALFISDIEAAMGTEVNSAELAAIANAGNR